MVDKNTHVFFAETPKELLSSRDLPVVNQNRKTKNAYHKIIKITESDPNNIGMQIHQTILHHHRHNYQQLHMQNHCFLALKPSNLDESYSNTILILSQLLKIIIAKKN